MYLALDSLKFLNNSFIFFNGPDLFLYNTNKEAFNLSMVKSLAEFKVKYWEIKKVK